MLPAPVSFSPFPRRSFRTTRSKSGVRSLRLDGPRLRPRLLDVLLSRSRVTNLFLLLLLFSSFFSLILNFKLWNLGKNGAVSHQGRDEDEHRWSRLRGMGRLWESGKFVKSQKLGVGSSVDNEKALSNLTHLIIVPGHGVWTGSLPSQVYDEDFWLLDGYMYGHSKTRIQAFVDHIKAGVKHAKDDAHSLLVFSGGQTRHGSPLTEGISYHLLASSLSLLPPTPSSFSSLLTRATTENHALDSFQNLLFSIARFREVTQRYPERITVVGYEMKRRRFENLHLAFIRWTSGDDEERWRYIGIDPKFEDGEEQKAYEGEFKNAYNPYTRDPYGCHEPLISKRRSRDIFHRPHPYLHSAPEMRELLEWCPTPRSDENMLFDGPLPWDDYS